MLFLTSDQGAGGQLPGLLQTRPESASNPDCGVLRRLVGQSRPQVADHPVFVWNDRRRRFLLGQSVDVVLLVVGFHGSRFRRRQHTWRFRQIDCHDHGRSQVGAKPRCHSRFVFAARRCGNSKSGICHCIWVGQAAELVSVWKEPPLEPTE